MKEEIKIKKEKRVKIKDFKRMVIAADFHFPFFDFKKIKLFKDFCKTQKIDTIIFLGDLVDFYEISSFRKIAKINDTIEGIKFLREFFTFFDAKIYYKFGNHEERFFYYINSKAKEIADLFFKVIDIQKVFGVEIFERKDLLQVGEFILYHGHELNIKTSLYPSQRYLERYGTSAIFGHFHKLEKVIVKRNLIENGKIVTKTLKIISLPPFCNSPIYSNSTYLNGFVYIERTNSNNLNTKIFLVDNKIQEG